MLSVARALPASAPGTSFSWLVVRRLHRNWRRHLLLVRPETLLRWHRQGWRYFERLKLGIAVSYHEARPHQGLGQRRAQPTGGRAPPTTDGRVDRSDRLGGLLYDYSRAA